MSSCGSSPEATRASSVPCSQRVLSLILLLSTSIGRAAPAATLGQHWFEGKAETPAEAALNRAAQPDFGGAVVRVERLRAVAAQNPGTVAAGLAQLEIGLSLLEADRASEAIAALSHADVRLTALGDRAQLALGRAYETGRDFKAAAAAYQGAASAEGPLLCDALLAAASAEVEDARPVDALKSLSRALPTCGRQEAHILLDLARAYERTGDLRSAATLYDRLDRNHPASQESREAAPRLRALAALLPPTGAAEQFARDLAKAQALHEAGERHAALPLWRALSTRRQKNVEDDLVRTRLGQTLASLGKKREALSVLATLSANSAYAAEAAYERARMIARQSEKIDSYEEVAARHPGTPWAAKALLACAYFHQKDARHDAALPYYRQFLAIDSQSESARLATLRVALADLRQGRNDQAAQALEQASVAWSSTRDTPAFLYWSGRARLAQGQTARARQIFEEAVARYKHTYHGMRASEALGRMPPAAKPTAQAPTLVGTSPTRAQDDIPETQRTRVRQLLWIERLEEAVGELGALSPATGIQATIAWIEWRRGRLRPAITTMKRAYPFYAASAGDQLPVEVWRILFPLQYQPELEAQSQKEGLDPSLVAALVCQESTFNAGALSPAGARGLMQVMPRTGRVLARTLGLPFRQQELYSPGYSLTLGTRYLREMIDLFNGRTECALAAYNAGPERVERWLAANPGQSVEDFIESIPFSETRHYVITVLANQAHYHRIYSLAAPKASTRSAATQ
jgi:soluble lytic murein transglycosylase